MRDRQRVVLDTNILISRLLPPGSILAKTARKAVTEADPLVSEETLDELADVLARPKFDPYMAVAERQHFIRRLGHVSGLVPVTHAIKACRDPRNDKFLSLAINGTADIIITDERDLLVLHPFRNIMIRAPADYLAQF